MSDISQYFRPRPSPAAPAAAPSNPPVSTNYPQGLPASTGQTVPFDESRRSMYEPGGQPPAAPADAPTPTAPAPAPGATPVSPQGRGADLTAGQQSVWDTIRNTLHQYQLDTPDVLDWARQQVIDNASVASITLDLYDPTTVPGRIVDQQMPGIRMRRENGLPPISIADYNTWRETYHQLLASYGVPQGVFDSNDYVGQQVGSDRSLTEIKADLDAANQVVNQEPPEVLGEMQRIYNIGPGGLIAHYLDPTAAAPILQRQAQAAIASGTAVRAGFGGLTQAQAEGLAALGTTQPQLEQGFSQLQQQQQIFQTLPGEGGSDITREEQLGAAFGSSAAAQQRIAQRVAARKAAFQGGGSVSAGRTGIIGAGAVPNA